MAPIVRPYSTHAGHQLACEEYAALGQDFCYWASRPHRLGQRRIALDREFLLPMGAEHAWSPLHSLLVAFVVVCMIRAVRRILGAKEKGAE